MYSWKKQINIHSFYPVLSPLSNDINVIPHLLVFTRNMKVEDMLSKIYTVPQENY